MEKRTKIMAVLIIIAGTLFSIFSFYFYQIYSTPNVMVDKEDAVIYVEEGTTFKTLRSDLYKKKMVQDLVSFSFMARLLDLEGPMKPGRYILKKNMTNPQAIRMLRAGNQSPTKITFNNVRTKSELAAKIARKLALKAEGLTGLLNSPEFTASLGTDTTNVTALFIPNTYEVYWTISPEDLCKRMKAEHDKFWNEERLAKAKEKELSPAEVSTLASILEEETNLAKEYPIIAGVYLNRLKKGIPLQADPTLRFALQDFGIKRVLNKHKELDSPYNTYKNAGLPPGPIRIASRGAIDGVLNATDHNFLYFCAKEDFSGTHNFAVSYNAHLKNARRYHRALNKAKIYR